MLSVLMLMALGPSQTVLAPNDYRLVYKVVGLKTDLPALRGHLTVSESKGHLYQRWAGTQVADYELVFDGQHTMVANSAQRKADCRKGFRPECTPLPLFPPFGYLAAKATKGTNSIVIVKRSRAVGEILVPEEVEITVLRKTLDRSSRGSYKPGERYELTLVSASRAESGLGGLTAPDLLPKGGQVVYYEDGRVAPFAYSLSRSFEAQRAEAMRRTRSERASIK